MTFLLDSSVLIPLCFPEHLHFQRVCAWIKSQSTFAVCPVTEGALLRYAFRITEGGQELATLLLHELGVTEGYKFWPDNISYGDANLQRVTGHNQVTDAYLVALAIAHGGRLATLDEALAIIHPEAFLIPPI